MATATNDHRLGGLKQYTFILLQFWRPEIQNYFHWVEVKALSEPILPPEILGQGLFHTLPVSGGC